jgi:multiple antibiotic resistance protein
MEKYTQAIFTILSLVNPVICAAIFSKMVNAKSSSAKMLQATKAIVAIGTILCLAALAGARVLQMFGISLDAFQVAGGMVLVWMGFIMLRGNSSPTAKVDSSEEEISLTPLILFAASPGTITGVITLSVAHAKNNIPVTAIVAVVVALAITWLVMILATRKSGASKQGLMHDVSSRFMGLIVLSMGVQFVLTGLKQFL